MSDPRELSCPRCGTALSPETAASHYGSRIEVDRCAACGGIFTNWGRILALSPAIVDEWAELVPDAAPDGAELMRHSLACPVCSDKLEKVTGADLPAHMKVPPDLELELCARGDGFWVEAKSLRAFKRAQTKNLERKRVDYLKEASGRRERPRAVAAAAGYDRQPSMRHAYSNAIVFLLFLVFSAFVGTALLTHYAP